MKIAATASYKAVPSMLMVAPTGSTKRVTLLSKFKLFSKHWNVTGRVAALKTINKLTSEFYMSTPSETMEDWGCLNNKVIWYYAYAHAALNIDISQIFLFTHAKRPIGTIMDI